MKIRHKYSILGGTFDRLHLGHQHLVKTAFDQSEKVAIGLTTEKLLKNKFLSQTIEDYLTRENDLKQFFKKNNYLSRSTLIPLEDIYGNSLIDADIQAIFVTETTFPNAQLINLKRKKLGLNPLEIIIVPLLKGDDGEIITSERIRYGQINRNGRAYFNVFQKNRLFLPENLREKLREPVGILVKSQKEIQKLIVKIHPLIIISVGDIISISLIEAGFKPQISIIDLKTRRRPVGKSKVIELLNSNSLLSKNEAGTISRLSVETFNLSLENYFKTQKKQTILIEGEEDLLAIPAIMLAPLKSIVLYGQHDLGVIAVEITEQKKQQMEKILKKFN